ncbi:MAG: hypothetical protein NTW38_04795 [Candidatus Aminicenantes bacterium]|nr:hypothetical protein [Candidatus Aminicenantes bacterium]
MNKQLIIKEWKEKFWVPVFALAFLVLFAVAALAFAGRRDFLDALTGAIQLFFLPLIGILLGASAFSSEFKEGSWAYLFSRPLKKSMIWLSKAVALAGLLAAIFLVYYIFLPLIPGFKERLNEIQFWGISALLSFGLFFISFSLSYLTEKQFLIVFFSMFIPAGLGLLFSSLLRVAYLLARSPAILIILIGVLGSLVFMAASLYAFCRTDFSQQKAKVFGFLKAFSLFLVLAVILGSAVFTIGERFQRLSFLHLETDGHAVYPNTSRGIYRYDADQDKLIKVSGASKFSPGLGLSVGGGKLFG